LIKHQEETSEKFGKVKNITTQLSKLANEHNTTLDNLDTEQLRLKELILMLAENSTTVQDKINNDLENHKTLIEFLCKARGEVETEIVELKNRTSSLETKVNSKEEQISSLQREIIAQNALHEIEVQELKTTIEKQNKSMLNLTALVLLWYYSNK
jgi:chromosome segregation ATPase